MAKDLFSHGIKTMRWSPTLRIHPINDYHCSIMPQGTFYFLEVNALTVLNSQEHENPVIVARALSTSKSQESRDLRPMLYTAPEDFPVLPGYCLGSQGKEGLVIVSQTLSPLHPPLEKIPDVGQTIPICFVKFSSNKDFNAH